MATRYIDGERQILTTNEPDVKKWHSRLKHSTRFRYIPRSDYFYASAQRSMARGIMVLSSPVCPCVGLCVHPRYLIWHIFTKLTSRCIVGQGWTHQICSQKVTVLGSKSQRSRSQWNKVCLKQHFMESSLYRWRPTVVDVSCHVRLSSC